MTGVALAVVLTLGFGLAPRLLRRATGGLTSRLTRGARRWRGGLDQEVQFVSEDGLAAILRAIVAAATAAAASRRDRLAPVRPRRPAVDAPLRADARRQICSRR